jgi:hypothetical protein
MQSEYYREVIKQCTIRKVGTYPILKYYLGLGFYLLVDDKYGTPRLIRLDRNEQCQFIVSWGEKDEVTEIEAISKGRWYSGNPFKIYQATLRKPTQ